MISLEDNFQNLDKSSLIFQMESFSVSEINPEGKHEIIFHKGMTIECIQKLVDLYKEKIIEKKQGYIKDLIDNLTIYIHFFDKKQGDIGGIPRLLDAGQCNDAYSAVQKNHEVCQKTYDHPI